MALLLICGGHDASRPNVTVADLSVTLTPDDGAYVLEVESQGGDSTGYELIVVTSEKLDDLDGLDCESDKSVLRCRGDVYGIWTIPAGAPVVATIIGRERDPDTTNNVAMS